MATQSEIKHFIITLGKLAVAESNRRIANGEGFVLPSVCIAQSSLETGWGTSDLMKKANAFFGIKAGGSWTGKSFSAKTNEVYNGKQYRITANFRAYDSLEDSVKDYYDLILGASRYANAISYYPDNVKSAKDTVRAIADAGYATDDLYFSKVYEKITYRDLTTWDKEIDGITTTPDYTELNLTSDKFKQGALYILYNNERAEVMLDETKKNAVSLLWEFAFPVKSGKYSITPAKGYTLDVIALEGETFNTAVKNAETWTSDAVYDKVAFTLWKDDGAELDADDIKFAIEGTDVAMSTPNYKAVMPETLAKFVEIE